MQDIHGIRGPVQVGIDPVIFQIIAGTIAAALILGGIIFFIRRYLKSKHQPGDIPAQVQAVPPFEQAMTALEKMLQKPVSDPRLFYFDLTAVLRGYIGSSFKINAVEMTSQEFAKKLSVLAIRKEIKKEILAFQNFCDPVKYAALVPESSRLHNDIGQVKKWIEHIHKQEVQAAHQRKQEKN